MSRLRTIAHRTLVMGGIDLRRGRVTARLLPRYVRDYRSFLKASARVGSAGVAIGEPFPITADRSATAGDASSAYFQQDLWAAKKIFEAAPGSHVDVGSRVDGFIGHLLVFRDVEVIDIRPLTSPLPGLTFRQEDATSLASIPSNSIESLSSLHAVEHFGLGRYGDPLDPLACFAAMMALDRVLAPGGRLYFSVPIGRERVEFNAHRILDPDRVQRSFPSLELASFAAIDDNLTFHENARPTDFGGADEATGLFEFTKPATSTV